jgi:hypothetical protein
MKWWPIVLLLLIPAATMAGEPKEGTETWGNAPEARVDLVPDVDGEAEAAFDRKAKRLTWRQQRELGLTRGNIIVTAIRMSRAGEVDTSDRDLIMNQVVAQIIADDVSRMPAYEKLEAPDWDAIFAFLEKLIPLLILIFGGGS